MPLPIHGLSLTLEYRLIGVFAPGAYYRGSVNEDIPVFTPAPVQAGTGAFHVFPAPSTPAFRAVQIAEHATFNNIFNHEILFGLRYAFNAAPPPPPPAPAPPRHGSRSQRDNVHLSLRCANRVREELIRDDVPASAIEVHGLGDMHLLVPTGPNLRERQNRRVEIIRH